ncbi:MAG: hypothetical protein GX039_02380, partial [Clostridia bacterium]|nr:hypothetical protein [Clostridia bacterium]
MRRRWRRPGQRSWWPVMFIAIIVLATLFLWEWRLRPAMEAVAIKQAHWAANEAIQKAVLEHLEGQVNYNSLIKPGSDASGQVVFMQADTLTISRLQAHTRLAIEESLAALRG